MILDDVEEVIRKYVVLSEDQYTAVTLWVAATHGINVWEHAPRLAILSPVKGCGKTRLMEVLMPMSYQPFPALNTTVAVLFRIMEDDRKTIFHDEVDTVFGVQNRSVSEATEQIRAFYNGGFSRDFPVWRMVGQGKKMVPVPFDAFSMAALASKTHDLPDTIQDRSIVIRMRKRGKDEPVDEFRTRDKRKLEKLGLALTEWTEANRSALESARPISRLTDRAADVWEPLLAVADVAGGGWPEGAREAAYGIARSERDVQPDDDGARVLRDIKRLWPRGRDRWATREMVEALRTDSESDWGRYDYGKGISDVQLSKLLRPYDIKPRLFKRDGEALRGYKKEWFEEAWERYR